MKYFITSKSFRIHWIDKNCKEFISHDEFFFIAKYMTNHDDELVECTKWRVYHKDTGTLAINQAYRTQDKAIESGKAFLDSVSDENMEKNVKFIRKQLETYGHNIKKTGVQLSLI